jgi:hypothetical protein
MTENTEFDVEKYRRSHESNTEWKLRRQFIIENHELLDENRLLCLANCFINVECYGCKYPEPVMLQLKELSQDLEREIADHKKVSSERKAIKFVKAR